MAVPAYRREFVPVVRTLDLEVAAALNHLDSLGQRAWRIAAQGFNCAGRLHQTAHDCLRRSSRWSAAAGARAISAMPAGRTRHHLPTIFAPAAIHCRGQSAEYRDHPVQVRRRASHSSPLFGYTITGLPVTSRATAMAASTSAGAQQFTPDRYHFRHAGGDRERLGQRLPGTSPPGSDGVAQPGRDLQTRDRGHQRLSVIDIGHRLQREHVRAGPGQHLQPWPVPAASSRTLRP